MSNGLSFNQMKAQRQVKRFKANNRYKSRDDNKAFDKALDDTRKAIEWQNQNLDKALPLGM